MKEEINQSREENYKGRIHLFHLGPPLATRYSHDKTNAGSNLRLESGSPPPVSPAPSRFLHRPGGGVLLPEEKELGKRIIHSMNQGGVCRIAPATPGLLISRHIQN